MANLVDALEMSEQIEDIRGDAGHILSRWLDEMRRMGIPARPHLLMQIWRINLPALYHKYDDTNS